MPVAMLRVKRDAKRIVRPIPTVVPDEVPFTHPSPPMAVDGLSCSVECLSMALDTFSINADSSTFTQVAIGLTRPLNHWAENTINLRFTEILE